MKWIIIILVGFGIYYLINNEELKINGTEIVNKEGVSELKNMFSGSYIKNQIKEIQQEIK